jgi:hypothetical protein
MKRAKIVLTAMAVFAVASGVLAFKANRLTRPFYSNGGAGCTVQVGIGYTTSPQASDGIYQNIYYTVPVSGVCPFVTIYTFG